MRRSILAPVVLAVAAFPGMPAQAAENVPRRAVERAITNQIAEVLDQSVRVRCPRSTWAKGEVFFCDVKPTDGGARYRVKVTLGNPKNHAFRWRQAG